MGRFSIYQNTDDSTKTTPYILDVQTDLLSGLNTRIVIPLRKSGQYQHLHSAQDLMPNFAIQGKNFILDTPRMVAVPSKYPKKEVGNLRDQQHIVIAAIDRLFHGFQETTSESKVL
jgi:toxin CcdB